MARSRSEYNVSHESESAGGSSYGPKPLRDRRSRSKHDESRHRMKGNSKQVFVFSEYKIRVDFDYFELGSSVN